MISLPRFGCAARSCLAALALTCGLRAQAIAPQGIGVPSRTDPSLAPPSPDGVVVILQGHGGFYLHGVASYTADPVRGTALLEATVGAQNTAHGFRLRMELAGLSLTPPPGSPYLFHAYPRAFVQNGGPIDPSTFHYYTELGGTLVGFGYYNGQQYTLRRRGPSTQVGGGAGMMNRAPAVSTWFSYSTDTGPPISGDLTIDLRGIQPGLADVRSSAGNAVLIIPALGGAFRVENGVIAHDLAARTARCCGELVDVLDPQRRFLMDLRLGGRIDPGSPAPAGTPRIYFNPSSTTPTGPIVPADWIYYTDARGELVGVGAVEGALVDLTSQGAFQLGVGAAGIGFGEEAQVPVVLSVRSQPSQGAPLQNGTANLHIALGPLSEPMVFWSPPPTVTSVGADPIALDGVGLELLREVEIGGARIKVGAAGSLGSGWATLASAQRLELRPPQCIAAGVRELTLIRGVGDRGQVVPLHVVDPAAPVLVTDARFPVDRMQRAFLHIGTGAQRCLAVTVMSASPVPSSVPGFLELELGDGFRQLLIGATRLVEPCVAFDLAWPGPDLVGRTMYFQTVFADLAAPGGLATSARCATLYLP